jgi:small subunit ribosomal protein S9
VTERPEDEQQADDQEPTAPQEEPEAQAPSEPEEPEAAPESPAVPEPEAAHEPEAAPEPEAVPVPEPEPEAAPEPASEAAPEPDAEPAIRAEAEVGDPEAVQPDVVVEAAQNPEEDEELEEIEEIAPREKPEIPGADLIPDIIPEGEQFLDAEAQAAAEAEAAELAARQQEEEEVSSPIADAAIDLAAGARYTATGKRKTAVARVIIKPGTGVYVINGKELDVFFPRETLRRIIRQPLETVGYDSRMDVVARMHGGGVSAQAGALRHGISRALIVADPNLRGELKRRGFLTRDPRVKERKKAGLKKARKRPQFSKR